MIREALPVVTEEMSPVDQIPLQARGGRDR
jgi:hypothetical protein